MSRLTLVVLPGLFLAACQTPDLPCCVRPSDGGACLKRTDVPLGSSLARRFVQLASAECERQVCVSDETVRQTGEELKGYCSVPCRNGAACPGSKLGPMTCMQLIDDTDDAGVSVCVRPPDAGAL